MNYSKMYLKSTWMWGCPNNDDVAVILVDEFILLASIHLLDKMNCPMY